MGRTNLLLLLCGLLLAAASSAAGDTVAIGTQPEHTASASASASASPCDSAMLADQVSYYCLHMIPTAECCEPVVASVHLRCDVGLPCLCRVAEEPDLLVSGLGIDDIVGLYTSCGGLRPVGPHVVKTCTG